MSEEETAGGGGSHVRVVLLVQRALAMVRERDGPLPQTALTLLASLGRHAPQVRERDHHDDDEAGRREARETLSACLPA